jgi:selenocysteine-specific elongation factor
MAKYPSLIMGTAGHVDHGKTSLVKALTGVDLDTLPEEQARGMTINLGFTAFDTPGGLRLGVVDVPGHRRFIKTMLAGAHGIDFVLFLVASDDGVMPQTREHLEILKLLGVEAGIVVLTKIDLVDAELLALVETEVEELVKDSFLAAAPVVKVSSQTGAGLPELIAAIESLARQLKPRERGGFFRLFVDRVFSVPGSGTVVTGTTLSGALAPGDEVEILPAGGRARVRQLEMHGETVARARAGQRTAVNLRLADRAEVKKGDLLATPGYVKPTYMVDAKLHTLTTYPKPLLHWTRVRFYVGTSETFGRVVLLDTEQIEPGQSAFVQIRLESRAPLVTGDPFIIRDFSASWTIGGGRLLDAHPTKHKRKRHLVVSDLARREAGYLEEIVELELKKAGYFVRRQELAADLDAPLDQVGAAAGALAAKGLAVVLPPKKSPWLIHQESWERLRSRVVELLTRHHKALPQLERGLAEEELRERVAQTAGALLAEEPFHEALQRLVEDRALKVVEGTYALSEHVASLNQDDEAALARIRSRYADSPLSPPTTEEVYAAAGLPKAVVRDFLDRLLNEGVLVRVSREFFFERTALERVQEQTQRFLEERGRMTVAEFRDLVGAARPRVAQDVEDGRGGHVLLAHRVGDRAVVALHVAGVADHDVHQDVLVLAPLVAQLDDRQRAHATATTGRGRADRA